MGRKEYEIPEGRCGKVGMLNILPPEKSAVTLSKTDVSIVTYKTDLTELATCLDCLASECVNCIVVVDNGDESRIKDFLSECYPNVIYIGCDNVGYGAGHNRGINYISGKYDTASRYHLVINTDIEFQPEVITRMIAVMDGNKDIALMHPRMVNPDGSRQYTARMLPTPFDLILRRFLPSGWFSNSRERYLMTALDCSKAYNMPYHQGSFMLFRRSLMIEEGMFDERFFMYPEDIDITRRLNEKYLTVYYPFESVIHRHRSASYHSMKMMRVHIFNMIKYFNKWGWWFDGRRRRVNRILKKLLVNNRES